MGGFVHKVSNFYIILLITGFLFVGTLPKLIGMSESSLSIQYRIVVVLLSIILILSTVFSKRFEKIKISDYYLFLLFWLLYIIRIVHDLYINPIVLYPDKPSSEYIQFAFGVVLIPAIAIILIVQANRIDFNLILKWIYRLLLFTLSVSIVYRGGSDLTGRNVGDVNVGILLFGQSGATLSILSIYYLTNRKSKLNLIVLYLFGFIVGFIGIFISASKSPFLALIAVLLFYILFRYGSGKSIVLISIVGLLINFYFIDIVIFLNQYFNSNFLDRLLYAVDVGGDVAREQLVYLAFNHFVESPFFGSSMLIQKEPYIGAYPHNIVLEAFMATGFLGGLLFVMWIFSGIRGVVKLIKQKSELSWVGLLFVQYLIFGMFSRNLFTSDLFWFFSILTVITTVKDSKYINKRESL